jgi:biopolymer transport protein ExbD
VRFPRPRRDPVEVNLTPLIDVVFLLLIFFMVSTTFETRQALELELPESESGVAAETSPVTVVVTAAGEYRLDDRSYTAGTLGDALAGQAEQAREHGLVVEADGRAAHADVVRVLDRAAGLQIRHVRIATEAASTPQAETP